MQAQPTQHDYLIFELTDNLYGVDARLVREMVRLPEITPLEDAPCFVLGVINLRGRVIPVLDLNSRLGRLPQEYYFLTDSVVVLEQAETLLGLLVNDVRAVTTLDVNDCDAVPSFEEFTPHRYRFVEGVARLGKELVMLLAPQHLLHVYSLEVGESGADPGVTGGGGEILTARRRFNAEGGAAERQVFRERAWRLLPRLEQHALGTVLSMAVVRLYDELLCVDLTTLLGFAKVRQVTPIPCCPAYIVGNMNLRGDVLTLVDISQILGVVAAGHSEETMAKAMVVPMGRFEVGVLLHEVVDIIHVQQSELVAAPMAASAVLGEHLRGAVSYDDKMLGVLNVQAILADPTLLVNEEV